MSVSLTERLDALGRAATVAARHGTADEALALVDKARGRLGHGTAHTVVALAGSTGVGKSSLFNALIGADVSDVGVRRPTTGVAHAAVFGELDRTNELLDWLHVGRRHHVQSAGVDVSDFDGLVLIDLPDFDSTEASNRAEVDRLVELVDALVWVTDPQKYADDAFHRGYVQPLAGHGDVMHFVVNKLDVVPTDQHRSMIDDFTQRLRNDGIADPQVHAVSTTEQLGLDRVRGVLTDTVATREAMVDRLVADIRGAAAQLQPSGSAAGSVDAATRQSFVERLGRAAGADAAGDIVAAQHRVDARRAMGWPPTRIVDRIRRRQPISTLPRAGSSDVARSEIDLALRDLAEGAATGLDSPWPAAVRSAAGVHAEPLATQLTTATQTTARAAISRPRWWVPIAALQRLVTAVALIGAVWLLVAAVLGGFFQFDTDPLLIDTPGLEWIPLPSLMVLGGLLAGFLIALIVRIPVGAAAARRGGKVRRDLLDEIEQHTAAPVVADVDAVLAEHREMLDDLAVAAA